MAGRILATGALLGVAAGFAAARVHVHLARADADGRPGLSMEDLRRTYHGRPGWTLLASKIDGGTMERHVPVPSEKAALLEWAAAGARPETFDRARDVVERRCLRCHAPGREKADRPFTRTPGAGPDVALVRAVCEPDRGLSTLALARNTYAHLLGFTFVFVVTGGIVALGDAGRPTRILLVATPFAAMFVEVGCWWLARLHPAFCWGIALGGAAMSLSTAAAVARGLRDLWGPRPRGLRV